MEIISRQEAILLKKVRYFSGSPCRYGHLSERLVSNCGCLECVSIRHKISYKENIHEARRKNREWVKTKGSEWRSHRLIQLSEWRKANNKKINEYRKKYFQEHKSITREKNKEWLDKNRDRFNAGCRQRYTKDKEKFLVRGRMWRAANTEKVKSSNKEWRKKNPGRQAS